jgi:hypothetical protein
MERIEALEDFEEARPWIKMAIAALIFPAIRPASYIDNDQHVDKDIEKSYQIADRFLERLKADLEALPS